MLQCCRHKTANKFIAGLSQRRRPLTVENLETQIQDDPNWGTTSNKQNSQNDNDVNKNEQPQWSNNRKTVK